MKETVQDIDEVMTRKIMTPFIKHHVNNVSLVHEAAFEEAHKQNRRKMQRAASKRVSSRSNISYEENPRQESLI